MGSHHDFWAVWSIGGHLAILGGHTYLFAYKLNKTEKVHNLALQEWLIFHLFCIDNYEMKDVILATQEK